MKILAIDPGASGAIVSFDTTDSRYETTNMPETIGDIVALLQTHTFEHRVCYIESQTGCVGTKNSAPSMFKFGTNYGTCLGALHAYGFRIVQVRPQEWQAFLHLGTRPKGKTAAENAKLKREWKNKLKSKAQELFPHLDVTLANADALLLLEYGCQKERGM